MSWPQDQYTPCCDWHHEHEETPMQVVVGEHMEHMEHEEHEEHECHHHHHHREIPILQVTVDCTPVTFRTPGQARNVMSCPTTFTTLARCTCTDTMITPLGNGCSIIQPITQTFFQPVTCVCNQPPVCTPLPQVICPCNC